MNDYEMIRDYVENGSQASFAQVVSRYVNLVYSAAWRQTHDKHLAEDVSQAVFLILSQKAGTIKSTTVLPAWLYKTTRCAASNAVRLKNIRHKHEQRASEMNSIHMQSGSRDADDGTLTELEPMLDQAVSRLGNSDRQVVVLHYLQGTPLAEVGAALGLSHDAARKRLQRAVTKLRSFFAHHGSDISAVALGDLLIRVHQQTLAPQHLTSSISGAVASSATGTAAGAFSTTIAKGAIHMMFMTKLKFAAAVAASVLLVTGSTTIVVLETAANAAPPAATAAPAPAPAPAPLLDTPLKAMREMARSIREGDSETVEQFIHGTTPEQKHVIKAQANLCHSVYELRKAYGEAYGKAELAKLPPLAGPTQIPAGSKETVNGDRATITMPGSPMPLEMVKVDGAWKMPYSFLASSSLPLPPDRLAAWLEQMAPAFDELTLGITLGQYKKPADAMIAFQKRMAELAQSAMNAPATTAPAAPVAPAPAPAN